MRNDQPRCDERAFVVLAILAAEADLQPAEIDAAL
jgi:hypothetical protein